MTDDQAVDEAGRRWGRWAAVEIEESVDGPKHAPIYRVGVRAVTAPLRLIVSGKGRSWEAAFADADRRAARKSKRSAR